MNTFFHCKVNTCVSLQVQKDTPPLWSPFGARIYQQCKFCQAGSNFQFLNIYENVVVLNFTVMRIMLRYHYCSKQNKGKYPVGSAMCQTSLKTARTEYQSIKFDFQT